MIRTRFETTMVLRDPKRLVTLVDTTHTAQEGASRSIV